MAAIAQAIGVAGLIVISLAHYPFSLACGVAGLSTLMGFNYFASLLYNAPGNSHQRKGRAFGLNGASLGLGAAGGSFFGGLAGVDLGSRTPFLIAATLVATPFVVQAVAYWRLVRPL